MGQMLKDTDVSGNMLPGRKEFTAKGGNIEIQETASFAAAAWDAQKGGKKWVLSVQQFQA